MCVGEQAGNCPGAPDTHLCCGGNVEAWAAAHHCQLPHQPRSSTPTRAFGWRYANGAGRVIEAPHEGDSVRWGCDAPETGSPRNKERTKHRRYRVRMMHEWGGASPLKRGDVSASGCKPTATPCAHSSRLYSLDAVFLFSSCKLGGAPSASLLVLLRARIACRRRFGLLTPRLVREGLLSAKAEERNYRTGTLRLVVGGM